MQRLKARRVGESCGFRRWRGSWKPPGGQNHWRRRRNESAITRLFFPPTTNQRKLQTFIQWPPPFFTESYRPFFLASNRKTSHFALKKMHTQKQILTMLFLLWGSKVKEGQGCFRSICSSFITPKKTTTERRFSCVCLWEAASVGRILGESLLAH